MKRARFTEEQIIAVLKEHEAGAKTADLARKHGISEATLYNWKAKFRGMDAPEATAPAPPPLDYRLAESILSPHAICFATYCDPFDFLRMKLRSWTCLPLVLSRRSRHYVPDVLVTRPKGIRLFDAHLSLGKRPFGA